MREEIINIYEYEELSDSSKEKAREWFRLSNQEHGYTWDNENYESLRAFCDLFGAEIKRDYGRAKNDSIGELTGFRLHRYLLNNFYDALFKPKQYWICNGHKNAVGNNAKKRESKIFREWDNCSLIGYCMDNDLLEPIAQFMLHPDKTTTYNDLMDAAWETYKKAVRIAQEVQDSDEYIEDTIIANEYEFTADGKIF